MNRINISKRKIFYFKYSKNTKNVPEHKQEREEKKDEILEQFLYGSFKIWDCQLYVQSGGGQFSVWSLSFPMVYDSVEHVFTKYQVSTRTLFTYSSFLPLCSKSFY